MSDNMTIEGEQSFADTSKDDIKDVLIVDDSRTMRKMVILAISYFRDFNIIEAQDGLDALKKLERYNVRLIILDYNMPRMNGIEFMKTMRKNPRYKRIPVIMLTTESEEKKLVKGYVAGARVYMTKPFISMELVKVVETIRYWHMN